MRTKAEQKRAQRFIAMLAMIRGGTDGDPELPYTATCRETNEVQEPAQEPYNALRSGPLQPSIYEEDEHSLEAIGKVLGITRERVRMIEAQALRKLRHPSRSAKLKEFL